MSESNEVPLSANAQEAKEMMHQQLMRKMANKMMAAAIEEERQRRIQSEKEEEEDTVRRKAFDQLVVVQEDLVRCLNLMKVILTRGESLGGAVQLGLQLLASDTNLPCLGLGRWLNLISRCINSHTIEWVCVGEGGGRVFPPIARR